MNKAEFCNLTNQNFNDIDDEDWEVIQTVYSYHPMISDINGKVEIAALFELGGIGLLADMYPTANEICLYESAIQRAGVAGEKIEAEYREKLKALNQWHHENCNKETEIITDSRREIIAINERYKK